jgi:hypothetical protein
MSRVAGASGLPDRIWITATDAAGNRSRRVLKP